jgi:hypothetical protein
LITKVVRRASVFGAKASAGGPGLSWTLWDREAGDRDPLALALEIKTARWPSKDPAGNHGELTKLGIDVAQTTVAK